MTTDTSAPPQTPPNSCVSRSIALNYGRIRDVERELGNLQLQLKLTSGPKKHALEMLRKKIETQNERVVYVRARHTAAKAVGGLVLGWVRTGGLAVARGTLLASL